MKIDRAEVLRYLGWRGQDLDGKTERALARAEELCLSLCVPRKVVRRFALDGMRLAGTDVTLEGADIARHLAGCDEVYLFAATVGGGPENRVRALFYTDPALAVVLDAAATAAVESFADDVEDEIARAAGRPVRSRFSCGYGDLPLAMQRDFIGLLSAGKFAGIAVTEDHLLLPQKSVTALVGAGGAPAEGKDCGRKCAACGRKDCRYRT